MAEMDPIIKEALKRSSQMQGSFHSTSKSPVKETPSPDSSLSSNKIPQKDAKVQEDKTGNMLEFMLENKDQSLIFLLLVLLINENSDPTVLLALMYLLL